MAFNPYNHPMVQALFLALLYRERNESSEKPNSRRVSGRLEVGLPYLFYYFIIYIELYVLLLLIYSYFYLTGYHLLLLFINV